MALLILVLKNSGFVSVTGFYYDFHKILLSTVILKDIIILCILFFSKIVFRGIFVIRFIYIQNALSEFYFLHVPKPSAVSVSAL